jgi:hypothetical protein
MDGGYPVETPAHLRDHGRRPGAAGHSVAGRIHVVESARLARRRSSRLEAVERVAVDDQVLALAQRGGPSRPGQLSPATVSPAVIR